MNVETDRLLLRPLTSEEWTLIVNSIIDSGEVLLQFGCGDSGSFRDVVSEMNEETVVYCAMVLKSFGELIGYAGVSPKSRNLEFYVLGEFRRQGYAYEGIGAFLELCDLDMVVAETIKDNEPCICLLEKFGFKSRGFEYNFTTDQETLAYEWKADGKKEA